jgi:hypothetical protein
MSSGIRTRLDARKSRLVRKNIRFQRCQHGMLFVKREEGSCESVERGLCQILNRRGCLRQRTAVCRTLQVRKALYQKFDRLVSRAVPQVGRQRSPGFEEVTPESRSRASEEGKEDSAACCTASAFARFARAASSCPIALSNK